MVVSRHKTVSLNGRFGFAERRGERTMGGDCCRKASHRTSGRCKQALPFKVPLVNDLLWSLTGLRHLDERRGRFVVDSVISAVGGGTAEAAVLRTVCRLAAPDHNAPFSGRGANFGLFQDPPPFG
jgi:hypothetical protein